MNQKENLHTLTSKKSIKLNFLLLFLFIPFILLGQKVIQMEEQNGVFMIPCKVNGIPMKFVFDTGASNVTISKTEVLFLIKQGLITDRDIIGETRYKIANGKIENGIKINLKKIQIDDLVIENIVATIIDNEVAPLLLGQSALSQLGPYSIDGNELILQNFKNEDYLGKVKILDEKYGFKKIKFDTKLTDYNQVVKIGENSKSSYYKYKSDIPDYKTIFNLEFDYMILGFKKPDDLLQDIVLVKTYYYKLGKNRSKVEEATKEYQGLIDKFEPILGKPSVDIEKDNSLFWEGDKASLVTTLKLGKPKIDDYGDTNAKITITFWFMKQSSENDTLNGF